MAELSRAQALHTLNEHIGQQVHAAVQLDVGFGYQGVVNGNGVLTEMRYPEGTSPARPTLAGDEPTGLYRVGDMTIYVPEHGVLSITSSLSGPGIAVRIADNVGLVINWETGGFPVRVDRHGRR